MPEFNERQQDVSAKEWLSAKGWENYKPSKLELIMSPCFICSLHQEPSPFNAFNTYKARIRLTEFGKAIYRSRSYRKEEWSWTY